MNKRLVLLALAASAALAPWAAHAQDRWPSKPIEIIYPYPPGNDTDAITRVVAKA